MKFRGSRIRLLLAGLFVVVIGGLVALWFAPARENAMPDQLDLGTLSKGARVEIQVRMLTSANLTPIELAHQKIDAKLPVGLRSYWKYLDPKQLRSTNNTVDLAKLDPKVSGDSFFRITKVTPQQNRNWFRGNPFFEVELELDTSRAGSFSGELHAKVDRRRATLPIRFTVQERSSLSRALVISPFRGDGTDRGTHFNRIVSILSSIGAQVDYVRKLPRSLELYSLVLVADSELAKLSATEANEVRNVMLRGGRVVLSCNYFWRGTVDGANRVAEEFGLSVVDWDGPLKHGCTNIIADILTENVESVWLNRPSPIQIKLDTAKALVFGPEGNCYAGVARPIAGGELIVLAQSLWWLWANEFSTNSDNAILLRNFLTLTNARTAVAAGLTH